MPWSEEELAALLEADHGPIIGRRLFEQLKERRIEANRSSRRGRKKNSDFAYRVVAARWDRFRRLRPEQSHKVMAPKFIRHHRRLFADLGLKIGSNRTRIPEQYRLEEVLRKAVGRGRKAHEGVKARRRSEWQIMPTFSLADLVRGRQKRLVTDIRMYRYLERAANAALLGSG